MSAVAYYSALLFLGALIMLHLIASPYTKVEESFGTQAIHDFLHSPLAHLSDFAKLAEMRTLAGFDHLEFPGVVDRSCIGSLVVSLLTMPLLYLTKLKPDFFEWYAAQFGVDNDGLLELVSSRKVLGFLSLLSLVRLSWTVRKRYGTGVAWIYVMLLATQFHIVYYASRALSNSFALICVALSLSHLIGHSSYSAAIDSDHSHDGWIRGFVFAMVVFRVELVIYFVPLLLCNGLLVARPKSFLPGINWSLIKSALKWLIISLVITVAIDSWFWQKLTWPELSSVMYNVIENRSNLYGTQPFYYYFTTVLPKLLMLAFPLLLVGLTRQSMRTRYRIEYIRLLYPTLTYIGLYSILPHKELRFIIYTPLILNLFVAFFLYHISIRHYPDQKSTVLRHYTMSQLGKMVTTGVIAGNLMLSLSLLVISAYNYPGGQAIAYFNREILPQADEPLSVHVDTYTAMTGFTRFHEDIEGVEYDKTETFIKTSEYQQFDYLIVGKALYDSELEGIGEIVYKQKGFSKISIFPDITKWRVKLLNGWLGFRETDIIFQIFAVAVKSDDLIYIVHVDS